MTASDCSNLLREQLEALKSKAAKLRRSEEALKESETRYRAIVEAFDGLIYVCSQDYRIEFVNDAFINRTGYDPTGDFCYQTLHGLDQVCPWCVNDRVFRGETVRWEIQSPKDHCWYYIVNTPITHQNGSLSKQAMIVDITERKQMEQFMAAKREVLEMVARGRPIEETLNALIAMLEAQVPGMVCCVMLLNAAGTHLFHMASLNLPKDYLRALDGLPVGPDGHVCGQAAERGENIFIEDLQTVADPKLRCAHAVDVGFHACWCVPIRNRSARVLGTFVMFGPDPRLPSEWETQLVETAASLAGIAIERRQWEAALEQSERRYRTLFEESRDAICITTRDGDFVDANRAALELFGYRREELIGRVNVSRIYAYPEERKRFQQMIEQQGSLSDFEFVLRRQDGTLVECLLSSTMRRSEEGIVLGYQGIIRDVTRTREAERQLRKSEARYRTLFEESPICLLEIDISALRYEIAQLEQTETGGLGKFLERHPGAAVDLTALTTVVDANKATLELYQASSPHDLCAGLCAVFGTDYQQALSDGLMAIAERRPEFEGEATTRTSTGESRQIAFRWSLMESAEDRLSRLLVSILDISKLKALERERTNLTAMFGHDMKSALVVIQGFVMRLLNRSLTIDSTKREQYLNIVRKEAAKLEFLVDDFLEFARLQVGTLRMEMASTSLDRELQELLESYQDKAEQRHITLTLRNIEALPVIEADARRLRRVFVNLLDNAFKYSKESGTITIKAAETADRVEISFIDQGIGIEAEDLPYIFDPFHRGREVSSYDGYGVGLAAVKTIVEAHGGRVLVESRHGQGSTFTVVLPKQPRSPAPGPAPCPARPSEG